MGIPVAMSIATVLFASWAVMEAVFFVGCTQIRGELEASNIPDYRALGTPDVPRWIGLLLVFLEVLALVVVAVLSFPSVTSNAPASTPPPLREGPRRHSLMLAPWEWYTFVTWRIPARMTSEVPFPLNIGPILLWGVLAVFPPVLCCLLCYVAAQPVGERRVRRSVRRLRDVSRPICLGRIKVLGVCMHSLLFLITRNSVNLTRLAAVAIEVGVFVYCIKVYDPEGTGKAGWGEKLP